MEIRAFTISSSFEQHSSNFFASIKSSERRKWITLQKIAHSCQQKMRRINLLLERESDASEKKRKEKKKREENGGKRNFKVAVKLGFAIKTGPERNVDPGDRAREVREG